MSETFVFSGDLNGLTRPFVLLEDRLNPQNPTLLYCEPVEVVTCADAEGCAAAFGRIEAGLTRGLHAAGFMSYELGLTFEPHLRPLLMPQEQPLLWFGLFPPPHEIEAKALDAAFAALGPPAPIIDVHPTHSKAVHVNKVQRVLDYLVAGDAYQVNLTFDMQFRFSGDPLALYGAMRARQPVAHGGVVAMEGATIVSVSPELFLDAANGRVTTRPMKGTVPRGADTAIDQAKIDELRADPKQRAENVMIVDLMRNDLSRIAKVGSVKVPDLFRVETYPTLHTLTSTITAELKENLGLHAMMKAVFPCGSITGAPKHRAMEIIHELELQPRGVYTGSIGRVAPDGALNFNVAIRTAMINADGTGHYGVGGGIVMDSDPAGEYDECLLKARVLTDLAFEYGLIETLKWSAQDGFVRFYRHLGRLARSARQLGFVFDQAAIETEFAQLAANFTEDGDRRVRLELARNGARKLTAEILKPEPRLPLRVGIASGRLDPGDPFLRHKTTQRTIYETAFASAAASGYDEALLLNAQGFVAEATRSNIFVERDGLMLTPPLEHGLLPGILREELLESGRAIEHAITLDDLRNGRWFLGNSLRGLRQAELVEF